ncbi:MAG: hypothetical protein HQM08_29975 [Candidatus Riflebacteria bacterium]|nr:hypothetical protein [Candidatus Riflebacteria bacterium]
MKGLKMKTRIRKLLVLILICFPIIVGAENQTATYLKELAPERTKKPRSHLQQIRPVEKKRSSSSSPDVKKTELSITLEQFFLKPPRIEFARFFYSPEDYKEVPDDCRYFEGWASSYAKIKEETESRTSCDIPESQNLTIDERIALFTYTTQYFALINSILRNGTEKEKQLLSPLVTRISSALKKLPSFKGMTIRGIKSFVGFEEYKVGQIVTEKTFTSTTNDPKSEISTAFSFVLHITSKTGKALGGLSGHPEESEVLFDKGTRFQITDRKDTQDKVIVTMVEVE